MLKCLIREGAIYAEDYQASGANDGFANLAEDLLSVPPDQRSPTWTRQFIYSRVYKLLKDEQYFSSISGLKRILVADNTYDLGEYLRTLYLNGERRTKMADQKSHDNLLELKFSRTFEANPEFVFKALTHPDLIKKWFGPHGYTCPVVEVDLRVGGKWHIEMKPPEGEIIKLDGAYNVVNPPNALEYTWQWDEPDAKQTRVKVHFNPSGNRTEVFVEQGEFSSAESKEGHEQGWLASFDRLKDVLQA